MQKICPICGNSFEAKANKRYCSESCSKQGGQNKRDAWEKRTEYNENQRVKRQAERDRRRIEELELARTRQEEAQKQHEERLKRDRQALLDRAEAGDFGALEQLARERGDTAEAWRYFALREIHDSEEWGRKATTTVNDISVYNPDFVSLVMDSIKETGRCITRRSGLGEKLPNYQPRE